MKIDERHLAQLAAVVQAGGDLVYVQGAHPRRGQLQRQRHAIELVADLDHGGHVGVGQREVGAHGGGAIDEQTHGLVFGRSRGRQRRPRAIRRQA